MKTLTVLFDEQCAFCLRCVARLEREPAYIPLRFLPMRGATSEGEFEGLRKLVAADRFVVVSDEGEVYLDTNARLMILYALKRYRELGRKLSRPALRNLVNLAFRYLSDNREALGSLLDRRVTAKLTAKLTGKSKVRLCPDGTCGVTHG